ncbi:MAG: hypothetical protein LBH11_04460 [Propionibacteriaceae bacterium]|jgi:hypothetical protein|nr:hypothetical protein [Propionibacteriaceae bacterium]
MAAAWGVCIVVGSLVGCSASSDVLGGGVSSTPGERFAVSFSAWMEQILATEGEYLSDFERDVVTRAAATGRIEDTDYEEAHSLYASCMEARGHTDTYHKNSFGLYVADPKTYEGYDPDDPVAMAAFYAYQERWEQDTMECSAVGGSVEAFYATQQTNPGMLVNVYEVGAACLIANGFVDAGYTPADFEADALSDFRRAPFDPFDPVANDCLYAGGSLVVYVP